jgi:hypothetical protein
MNKVSARRIVAKVERDFAIPFTAGDVSNIVEWVGEALSQMGMTAGLKKVVIEKSVDNYRAMSPCNAEAITAITHNELVVDVVQPTTFDFVRASANKMVYFNFPYIECNFSNTRIKVHYLAFDVCKDGFPMIPDNGFVEEALHFYVLKKMLSRGYKHPVFDWNMAEQQWRDLYPKGQNAVKMPSIMSMEQFTKVWTSLIPYTNRNYGGFTNENDIPDGDDFLLTTQYTRSNNYATQ